MTMKVINTIILLSICGIMDAQNAHIWQQWQSGGFQLLAKEVVVMDSSHFLVLMNNSPDPGSSKRTILKKITHDGLSVDSMAIDSCVAFDVLILPSGEIMLAGMRQTESNSMQLAWATKLTSSFDVLWEKTYGETAYYAVAQASDGGFYLGGVMPDGVSPIESHIMLTKVSAFGNLIWTKSLDIGINENSAISNIIQLANGRLLIAGETSKWGLDPYVSEGFFAALVDASNGMKLAEWQNPSIGTLRTDIWLPGGVRHAVFGAAVDSENNVIFCAPGVRAAIFKFNSTGLFFEQIDLSNYTYRRYPTSIHIDADGNYLMTGMVISESQSWQYRPYLEKRKPSGELIWTKSVNTNGAFFSSVITPEGQMMAVGTAELLSYDEPCTAYFASFDSSLHIYPATLKGRVLLDDNHDCLPDTNPIGVPNQQFVLDDRHYLQTDAEGYFYADLDIGVHELKASTPSPLFEICPASASFQVLPQDSLVEVFFYQQTKKTCALVEVGVTMLELSICDTTTLVASWRNAGNISAQDVELTLELDDYFELIGATQPYSQVGNILSFSLGEVLPGESGNIAIRARLSCDAPAFAYHCANAQITPHDIGCYADQPDWSDAAVGVTGHCENGTAVFSVANQGLSPFEDPVPYQLYLDGVIVEMNNINFSSSQPVILTYPANGHTINLTLQQSPLYPVESYPTYDIEGCGTGQNGFFSTGFAGMFGSNVGEPWKSAVCMENDQYNSPNTIHTHSKSYGIYRMVNHDAEWFEYSVHISNTLDEPATEAVLEIMPGGQFIRESFQPIAGPGASRFELMGDGSIKAVLYDMHIPPDQLIAFRFKIKFSPKSSSDYDEIAVSAYLNGHRVEEISPVFHNIREDSQASSISPDGDTDDIQAFGRGNAFDWVADASQSPTGDVYLGGTTLKLDETQLAYLVKTDSTGRGIWQKTYNLSETIFAVQTTLALPDKSVLLGGIMHDITSSGFYLETSYCFLTKIDQYGEQVWLKKWKPSSGWGGSVIESIMASDGNALLWGTMATLGQYQHKNFVRKITPDGDMIWQVIITNGDDHLASGEGKLQELPDGRIILGGLPQGFYDEKGFLMIEISPQGSLIGNHIVNVPPQNFYSTCTSYVPTDDGGYMLACSHPIGGGWGDTDDTPRLVKLGQDFEVDWSKMPFGNELGDIKILDVLEFEGNYFAYINTILSDTFGGVDENVALLKINLGAETLDFRVYDANARENGVSMFMGLHDRIWMTAQTQSIDFISNLQMLLLTSLPHDVETDAPSVQLPNSNGVLLFPNPTKDAFNYELHDSHGMTMAAWEIIDLAGKKVLTGQGQVTGSVSTESLPTGLYYFRLITSKGNYLSRFVKI